MNTLMVILAAFSFLAAISTAVVIISKGLRSTVHIWLSLFLIAAGSWAFVVTLQSPSLSEAVNTWIVRATFIAAVLMVYAMFQFTNAIYAHQQRKKGRWQYLLAAVTFVLVVLMCTDYVISGVRVDYDTVTPYRTPIYYLVAVYILLVATLAVRRMGAALKRKSFAFTKGQLSTIRSGLLLGVTIGGVTNVILPNIVGNLLPAKFAWLAVLAWTVALLYSVVRHRFLDIRLAIVRTTTYVLSLVTLGLLYYGVALFFSRVVFSSVTSIEPLNILLALLLAFLFQPVKQFFDHLTNSLFYRDRYKSSDFFTRINRALMSTIDMRTMLERVARIAQEDLKAEYVLCFVRYTNGRYVSAGSDGYPRVAPKDIDALDAYIRTHEVAVLQQDDIVHMQELRRMLVSYSASVVVPLKKGGDILGYIVLGEQRSGGYGRRDISNLESIADEIVLAVQNVQSIQAVRDLNATLQQRIDNATKDLRHSNAQLRRLDEAKDEFVSMASHQLRTPLTSVKGYIDMVLEGDAGKITPMQRKLLTEAFTSSERMVHLINDFLNVSRLQTGKFIIDQHPIDLARVVSEEVSALRTSAEQRGLSLVLTSADDIPTLQLDEGKIRQVIMNFIDNAMYYSPDTNTIRIALQRKDDAVELTVQDKGMGVPADEQARLFTKFYRASNARKQRPDGTGVGLYLAKRVVTAHGGLMIFQAHKDGGSTFGFSLPLKRLRAVDSANELVD